MATEVDNTTPPAAVETFVNGTRDEKVDDVGEEGSPAETNFLASLHRENVLVNTEIGDQNRKFDDVSLHQENVSENAVIGNKSEKAENAPSPQIKAQEDVAPQSNGVIVETNNDESSAQRKNLDMYEDKENGDLKRKLETSTVENGQKDSGPVQKKQFVESKCPECDFKCYNEAELKTHQVTTHGQVKRTKKCGNCGFTSPSTWEMDFHCRSRGHKVCKDENIPCKKCDYLCVDKDDVWIHKKVHIPADKLLECGDCYWVGDRLDNIRYHIHSQGHNMKNDYEAIALAKAEAKGPKEVAQYHKKLAKDIKQANKGHK